MAHDGLTQELGCNELSDTPTRRRRVIGDHREIAPLLADDLIDHPLGRAHSHEPADHQACAVGDHGNRLFE